MNYGRMAPASAESTVQTAQIAMVLEERPARAQQHALCTAEATISTMRKCFAPAAKTTLSHTFWITIKRGDIL